MIYRNNKALGKGTQEIQNKLQLIKEIRDRFTSERRLPSNQETAQLKDLMHEIDVLEGRIQVDRPNPQDGIMNNDS